MRTFLLLLYSAALAGIMGVICYAQTSGQKLDAESNQPIKFVPVPESEKNDPKWNTQFGKVVRTKPTMVKIDKPMVFSFSSATGDPITVEFPIGTVIESHSLKYGVTVP